MSKEKIIGIDLGTTNSVVALFENNSPNVIINSEGNRTTPSVVSFDLKKKAARKVGLPAKRQAVINAENTIYSIKSFMGKSYQEVAKRAQAMPYKVVAGEGDSIRVQIGDRQYTPQELSAIILQRMKAIAVEYFGGDIKERMKAVITVPAYFNDKERQATKEAGEIAGLEVVRIINEPTAAALAYGLDKKDKDINVAVYDLGGGTFDISILQLGDGVFEVKATGGDVKLGGDNFDNHIINWLADAFKKDEGVDLRKDPISLQRLREAAEKAKIELSSGAEAAINLPYITAIDGVAKHLVKTLSRAQFERLIDADIEKTVKICEDVLKKSGFTANQIDEVILVGGSSRVPKVQEVVAKAFGKQPSKGVNPDEVVAQGAAVQGAVLAGDVDDVVLLDVTPLSLGIETQGGVTTKLIEAGATIPTRKMQIFSTAEDNQTSADIHVLQGERPMARDNRSIGRFKLEDIGPAKRGEPQIEVAFDINANGILEVTAKNKKTKKEQKIRIEASSNLSKEEIERMKQEAEAHAAEDKKEKEQIELFNKADTLLFRAEKELKEHGDKIANKAELEEVQKAVKEDLEAKDAAKLAESSKKLEELLQKVFQQVFADKMKGAQAEQGPQPTQASPQKDPAKTKEETEVADADFEEVKDEE